MARGEALPRLPRRTHEGQGPDAAAARARAATNGRAAPRGRWAGARRGAGGSAGDADRARRARAARAARRLGGGELPRRAQRRARRRTPGSTEDARRAPPQDGCSMLTKPTTILLLGTDHRDGADRQGARRSDSMMLVRTDPEAAGSRTSRSRATSRSRSRASARPRSTRRSRSAARRSRSGRSASSPAFASTTSRSSTSALRATSSTRSAASTSTCRRRSSRTASTAPTRRRRECDRWPGWRFAKGEQDMDGRRALVYSRIRENQLDPSESDITRGERQQAVTQAIARQADVARGRVLKLPFVGDDLARRSRPTSPRGSSPSSRGRSSARRATAAPLPPRRRGIAAAC